MDNIDKFKLFKEIENEYSATTRNIGHTLNPNNLFLVLTTNKGKYIVHKKDNKFYNKNLSKEFESLEDILGLIFDLFEITQEICVSYSIKILTYTLIKKDIPQKEIA